MADTAKLIEAIATLIGALAWPVVVAFGLFLFRLSTLSEFRFRGRGFEVSAVRHADFWQVTGDALDFALETLRLAKPGLRGQLMQLYLTLDPFPEVPAVLRQLRTSGFTTAILSNGTPEMLAAVVGNAGLGDLLDPVLSVEEVGIYKPHPKVYQLACDRFGVAASAIAFQSSNAWDANAASAFGMRTVWCNRYSQRRERLPGSPDREIRSLSELPPLLAAR